MYWIPCGSTTEIWLGSVGENLGSFGVDRPDGPDGSANLDYEDDGYDETFDIPSELSRDGGYVKVYFGVHHWYEGDGEGRYDWNVQLTHTTTISECE